MLLSTYINRIEQLDQLIRLKATGPPEELAEKLGITVRQWYRLRKELVDEWNFPIAYSTERKSYYYTRSGAFIFKFQERFEAGY